jgi:hypothetical protein
MSQYLLLSLTTLKIKKHYFILMGNYLIKNKWISLSNVKKNLILDISQRTYPKDLLDKLHLLKSGKKL